MILRIVKTKNFTTIANDLLQDRRLSWKAKGLMAYVLSLPDDWHFSIEGLATFSPDGRTTVETILKELKSLGYLTVKKINPKESGTGRFDYVYEFRESPTEEGEKTRGEKQGVEILGVEKLGVENLPLEKQPLEKRLYTKTKDKELKEQRTKEQRTKEQKEIVDFLNQELGTKYRSDSKAIREMINGRLSEGYTVEDFKTVISNMAAEWSGDEKMSQYLRPSTLFAPTHFPEYLNRKPKKKVGKSYFADDDDLIF